jgi:hypothetical protein
MSEEEPTESCVLESTGDNERRKYGGGYVARLGFEEAS